MLSEVRSRYIDNWQQARAEQNNQVISDIESIPGDKIANYKLRTGQENRVHAEVELLVNIAINVSALLMIKIILLKHSSIPPKGIIKLLFSRGLLNISTGFRPE